MIEVALKDVVKYYGANKVLDGVTFEVNTEDRVGIIGRNGEGKTTIFKVISGMEQNEEGTLTLRKGITIGYMEQVPVYNDDETVEQVLYSAFKEIITIKEKMQKLEQDMKKVTEDQLENLMKKYGVLQSNFESMDGYNIEEKVNRVYQRI
jgi:ATPase subunit of ABC transporter with duplicated ATPase domains